MDNYPLMKRDRLANVMTFAGGLTSSRRAQSTNDQRSSNDRQPKRPDDWASNVWSFGLVPCRTRAEFKASAKIVQFPDFARRDRVPTKKVSGGWNFLRFFLL